MPFCVICQKNFGDESTSTGGFICRSCTSDPLPIFGNSQPSSVSTNDSPTQYLPLPLKRCTVAPAPESVLPVVSSSRPDRLNLQRILSLRPSSAAQTDRMREHRPIYPSIPINGRGMNNIFYSKQQKMGLRIAFDQMTPPSPFTSNPNCAGFYSITFGDLHGNTLILIMVLVRFGFMEFPNVENYQRIRQIIIDACSQPLTIENYIEFRTLLYQCTRCNRLNIRVIRLLGDIIGDRQSNDALTLAVLGFLLAELPATYSVTILFSNHDKNLIDYLIDTNYSARPFDSLERLNNFFTHLNQNDNPNRFVVRENILNDMRLYVSCIKLFDYELLRTESDIYGRMCIFTHAPLHPKFGFFALLDVLGRDQPNLRLGFFNPPRSLSDFTKYELMDLIRSTNQIFSEMLLNILNEKIDQTYPPIRTLRSPAAIPSLQFSQSLESLLHDSPAIAQYRRLFVDQYSACSHIIWFRLPASVRATQTAQAYLAGLSLPKLVDGVALFNVHGHDLNYRPGDISLDNEVGKFNLTGECVLKLLAIQNYDPLL